MIKREERVGIEVEWIYFYSHCEIVTPMKMKYSKNKNKIDWNIISVLKGSLIDSSN